MNKIFYKKRRSVSTIIGIFIFIAIMVGGFSALVASYQFNVASLNERSEISKYRSDKLSEDFSLIAMYDWTKGFALSVDIINEGVTPLEFSEIWIINKDSTNHTTTKIDILPEDSFVPAGTKKNLLEHSSVTLNEEPHLIKAVTTRGNFLIANATLFADPETPLTCFVKATPKEIANNANVTISLVIQNNSTRPYFNLTPPALPTVDPESAVVNVTAGGVSAISSLAPGDQYSFHWKYKLQEAVGRLITFTMGVTGGKSSILQEQITLCNPAVVSVRISHDLPDQFLTSSLVQSPGIFMVLPNPVGDGAGSANAANPSRGFWGMVVVNPTNQTLIVNAVTLLPVNAQGGTKRLIFADEPAFDHVHPVDSGGSPIGDWTIPENNMLHWEADVSTETLRIPAFDAQEFIIRVRSNAAGDSVGVMFAGNIYSSAGQFSQITHSTAGRDADPDATVVNAYPTGQNVTTVTSAQRDYDDATDLVFEGVKRVGIECDEEIWITAREGQDDSAQYIPGGEAWLIINLPSGFPDLSFPENDQGEVIEQQGFGPHQIRTYSDGAKQIAVPIEEDLGDVGGTEEVERFSFNFNVTTPELEESRMYLFYVYINGTDVEENPLGPVSESVVLKVDPDIACS